MSNPLTDDSLINLAPSLCPEHNQPYNCYCSFQKCEKRIRVCAVCRDEHSGHLNFLTEKKQVDNDLNKGLKRCFDKVQEYDKRAEQLLKLMNQARQLAHNEYEQLQSNLITRMKCDKETLQGLTGKMRSIATKIEQKQQIKNYFSKLRKNNLFQLRIKLSTTEGMRALKEKNEKLRELTSKVNYDEIHKLYESFYFQKKNFNHLLQNNITFKMAQIIAMKNSKRRNNQRNQKKTYQNDLGDMVVKQMRQRDEEKENIRGKDTKRQKAKAKTTLNIGEGIISGILNFLNL